MSYPSYPEYKASNVEWLEAIPEHWKVEPLFTLFSERRWVNRGMKEDNLLSLSYGAIVRKDIDTDEGLLPESFETYQLVFPDDLIFRLTDLQNDKRSLRSAISTEKGIITSAYLNLVPRKCDAKFAHYLFRSYDLMKVFYAMGSGLRQSLKFSDIKRMPVLLPPHQEQTQIARFLDHQTARIDALVAEQQRLIELLKEKRQALTLSGYSSDEWPEVRLENVADIIERPVYQQEGEQYVALGLFNRGRGLFHKEPREKNEMGESDFYWVEADDLIISGQFAWEGAVALAGDKEAGTVASHRYPIIRGNKGVALTEYIYSLLTTSHGDFLLNENSRGAAGRNRPLNVEALLKEKIKLPPIPFQSRIADLVHKENKVREEVEKQKKLLLEHRSALISAAVTGKIVVRDWEPPVSETFPQSTISEETPA